MEPIDDAMQELQLDLLIADIGDNILPKMTAGQLDALRYACDVELKERYPDSRFIEESYNLQ